MERGYLMEQVIKQYTAYLLKLAYLITRDRKKVDEIVQMTFIRYAEKHVETNSIHKQKIQLVSSLNESLQSYFKSSYYAKLKLTSIFEETDRFSHAAMQDDLSYQLLKLSPKLREVAAYCLYGGLSVSETAKVLQLPPATIHNRFLQIQKKTTAKEFKQDQETQTQAINPYLTEWDEYAVYVIEDLLRMNLVQQPVLKKKKPKKWLYIGILVCIGLGLLSFPFIKKTNKVESKVETGQEVTPEITLEQTVIPTFFGSTVYPYAIEKEGNLYPDEKAIEMSQLEAYYLAEDFPTWGYAERKGILSIHKDYSAYYHLMKYNFVIDQKTIDQYYDRADLSLRTYKERPGFKEFLALLQEKGYSEEDYKLRVLVPNQLNAYFERLIYEQKLGDDTYHASINEYIMIADADISDEAYELYHDYSVTNDLSQYEKLSYDELPFYVAGDYYEFGKTAEGELIILNPNLASIDLLNRKDAAEHDEFYLYKFHVSYPIARLTIARFIEDTKHIDYSNLVYSPTEEGIKHWTEIMELFQTSLQYIK